MSTLARTALFGVTPLSLLLGRACCLADQQPVGLYDPDPQNALRGALFLGVSARHDPNQLNPPERPLEVALLAHEQALSGLTRLACHGPPLLVISLARLDLERDGWWVCQAALLNAQAATAEAIAASIPELKFRLEGPSGARKEAGRFLRALSPSILVEDQAL